MPAPLRVVLATSFVVIAVVLQVAPASAQVNEVPRIRFKQVNKVYPNGDVDLSNELTFSLEMYNELKKAVPNTTMLLRELGMTGHADEVRDMVADFDDNRRAVRASCKLLGGFKNQGRRWMAELLQPDIYEVVDTDPEAVTLLAVDQLDNGTLVVGTVRTEFPEGTKSIEWDARRGGLTAELPADRIKSDADAIPDVDMRIDARDEVMSCLYKAYGNPDFPQLWVARAVFQNVGDAPVEDFRVRFRLPEYSPWSPWKRSKTVYPTQTVVEAFYPIFDHKVRDLTSETPAMVEVEWEYKTPDGETVTDSDSQRLAILGLNEVLFSSMAAAEMSTWFEAFNQSPLIGAAFVAHNDPIIQRFAGMAAEAAGGVAASVSNEGAVQFMAAVYAMMVHNEIKYQSPPWLMDARGGRQHVKFGRDVLRNRAGTCIDLAILFASTCEAGGLKPCLVFLPGHCFPAIKLPEGGVLPVEATMISNNTPFEQAVQTGMKELAECQERGLFYLVDVYKMRSMGVPVPELPKLPESALDDWHIERLPQGWGGGGQQQQQQQQEQQQTNNRNQTQDNNRQVSPSGMQRVSDQGGRYAFMVPATCQVQQNEQMVAAVDQQSGLQVSCAATPKMVNSLSDYAEAMIYTWVQTVPQWQEVGRVETQVSGYPALVIRASGVPDGQTYIADYVLVMTNQNQYLMMFQCLQGQLGQQENMWSRVMQSWTISQ